MTWKNLDGFDTVQKMGTDLEKSRQFWNRPENKKWSWKIWSVVKLSGKWETILKNLESFKTVRKMGNYLEKFGQLCHLGEPSICKWTPGKVAIGSQSLGQSCEILGNRVALPPGNCLVHPEIFSRNLIKCSDFSSSFSIFRKVSKPSRFFLIISHFRTVWQLSRFF